MIKVDNFKSLYGGLCKFSIRKKKKGESDMYEERCLLNFCDSDIVFCGRLCKLLFVVSF